MIKYVAAGDSDISNQGFYFDILTVLSLTFRSSVSFSGTEGLCNVFLHFSFVKVTDRGKAEASNTGRRSYEEKGTFCH